MKNKTFIIAEAGVNHNGSLSIAKKMVKVAHESGADAIKFQTFNTNEIASRDSKKAAYQNNSNKDNETQFDMLKKLELTKNKFITLNELCKKYRIEFMSTPFDAGSAEFLVKKVKIKKIKIPSGELINSQLLYQIGKYKRPIILSTGMCTIQEVEYALDVIACGIFDIDFKKKTFKKLNKIEKKKFNGLVTLMQCTSEYPAPYNEINLNAIRYLKDSFNLRVGLSDHSMGTSVPVAAVALGANVIEKHFTLDKTMLGPDHKCSLEPYELKEMIDNIRQTEKAMGNYNKTPTKSELKNISVIRRNIIAKTDIKKGEKFTDNNITMKRTNYKTGEINIFDILNRTSKNNYKKNQLINEK